MDQSIMPIAALILFGFGLNSFLKKAGPKRNGFPTCFECKRVGVRQELGHNNLPDEIEYQLHKLGLPAEKVVNYYVCPIGCTHMWYLPRLGNMDKGILKSQRL